jgi:DNA-binding PadR family transcriptional regulator
MAHDTRRDPDAQIPLKHVDLQILIVLADQDLHGYGLVKAIEARTDGHFRLEPGNLYRYIRRLVNLGMVAPADRRRAEDVEHERRRYYRITAFGRRVLAAEVQRLKALVEAVESLSVLPSG